MLPFKATRQRCYPSRQLVNVIIVTTTFIVVVVVVDFVVDFVVVIVTVEFFINRRIRVPLRYLFRFGRIYLTAAVLQLPSDHTVICPFARAKLVLVWLLEV